MAYLAKIHVTLRPSILDPQGKAVEHAIAMLGVSTVRDVRMGKYIELKLDTTIESEARQKTDEVCRKLLANPIMEDFTVDMQKL